MSIVFINHNQELFYCEDNHCKPLESKVKNEPVVATVDPKKVITHSFKTPLNISNDELALEVEMRLFDEAGLNTDDEYKIDYILKKENIEETENMVEAFAIKEKDLDAQFQKLLPTVKHIDLITLPYIAYQGLYERKILEPKNDVFVQLSKDISYIALCSGGKYIYARQINDLKMLYSGLDKDFDLDLDGYINLLHTKGLKESKYGEEEKELLEAVQSQFQAIYNRINDTIMYNRNIFGFEKADRIFIDCENGWIEGFEHFVQDVMLEQAPVLSMRESLNLQCEHFSTYDCISAEYAMVHLQVQPNLTKYERKVPLHKSFLAKMIYVGAAATVLSSSYPLFMLYQNNQLQSSINNMQNIYNAKIAKQGNLVKELKNTETEIEQINQKIKKIAAQEKDLIQKMQTYLSLDKNNAKDLLFLQDATKSLQIFNLHTTRLGKQSGQYFVTVYTNYNSRDLVTKLMDRFLKLGYEKVETDKIYIKDDRYNCTVKIGL